MMHLHACVGVMTPPRVRVQAQLNFYVDCRANFANLDAVLDTLVMGATRHAMQTHTSALTPDATPDPTPDPTPGLDSDPDPDPDPDSDPDPDPDPSPEAVP